MKEFYTRICNNSQGWQQPTGLDEKQESKESYTSKHGFGHEEWLFNPKFQIDGFQYGMIEGFRISHKLQQGEVVKVYLYTIVPVVGKGDRIRLYVGTINKCEILGANEAVKAIEKFDEKSLIDLMIGHVKQLKADIKPFKNRYSSPLSIFNIRFRMEDVDLYDPPVSADPRDPIFTYNRYRIVGKKPSDTPNIPHSRHVHSQGSTEPLDLSKPRVSYHKPIVQNGTRDLMHSEIQNDLLLQLQKKYGKAKVKREEYDVDVLIKQQDKWVFIEIKNETTARQAIRLAIGQLLEYCYYYPEIEHPPAEFYIVNPAPLKPEDTAYLKLLNTLYRLRVEYRKHMPGSDNINI
ncbi:hypothetical protein KQI63_06545 [bacterium]|nr:hypothetical protein [bacterium]